jgi:D-alanyl-lipoteichoic acid acyltransferase DltB (MBOAT superfamily)
MLFNSYEFLFVFLPLVTLFFFLLNHRGYTSAAKFLLLFSSFAFYAWWNPAYLPLLLCSICVNYGCSLAMVRFSQPRDRVRKRLMVFAVVFNVCFLGYFKYMDFFIANVNMLGLDIPLLHLALPLAISFFSLQQIAYVVDTYRGLAEPGKLLNYSIFVSFFPQLIAGPIVHHRELIPQLEEEKNRSLNFSNLSLGLFLFSMGLFKKVVLADMFAVWASNGFDSAESLNMIEAWIVSYSYTLQLYFDFSAYSDMALGLALMFNIALPVNFNSPYQATSIINLWQRWHLTLTRFINMYIYKPVLRALPRVNFVNGMVASFIAMMIAGIWHGAAWTFVVFGALQGIAIVLNHIWRRYGFKLHPLLGWLITFHFFSFSLVIFRATQWSDALKVYQGMLGLSGIEPLISMARIYGAQTFWFFSYASAGQERTVLATLTCVVAVVLFILHVALLPNSNQLADRFQLTWRHLVATVLMLTAPITMLSNPSEFIYFQF